MRLDEAFDNPFQMRRSTAWDDHLAAAFPVRGVFSYWTALPNNRELVIAKWYHDSAIEFHFFIVVDGILTDHRYRKVLKPGEMNRILATAASMIVEQLAAKTHVVRILSPEPEFLALYRKVVAYFAKNRSVRILTRDIHGYQGADGEIKDGFVLVRDTRSIKLEGKIPNHLEWEKSKLEEQCNRNSGRKE